MAVTTASSQVRPPPAPAVRRLCVLGMLAALCAVIGMVGSVHPAGAVPYPPVAPSFAASAPLETAGPDGPALPRSSGEPSRPAPGTVLPRPTTAPGSSPVPLPEPSNTGLRNRALPSSVGALFVTVVSAIVLIVGGSILVIVLTRRGRARS